VLREGYIELSIAMQQLITAEQAWHYSIIPKESNGERMILFIDETCLRPETEEEIGVLLGKEIVLEPVDHDIMVKTLAKFYRRNACSKNAAVLQRIKVQYDDFFGNLVSEAKSINSSDIHIEAYKNHARIRMRIDGKLIERYEIDKNQYPSLTNRIKILANLDIAEKRLPQDGRILFDNGEKRFDIRVSVIPTLYGEKTVLRLLSKDASRIDIYELGFSTVQLEHYLEAVKRTSGIILISGPTGSGKTTTLYATLRILNREETNILTIEDPVEYTLEGINQVQLKETIGLTFASALRTFLRQDPDIIMLGEIRDSETAQMAIRAALTGHLVLSTIHTNSAWGTVSRLTDMDVPPFLLAGTLNLAVSQRLVRLLCPQCKKQEPFNRNSFPKGFNRELIINNQNVATGCPECFYTGYSGRKAVFEVIPVDSLIIDKIRKNEQDVSNILVEKRIEKISDTALNLFLQGETTLEEIYPILLNDEY
jgi:general secretion pathway protein E/type IV pilus assembly protein PilB